MVDGVDRDQQVQDELGRLIRTRPPGTTPAAAIREFVLESVEGIRHVPPKQWRGELGYLATISPTVHRLALEMSDRQANAVAIVISETTAVAPEMARLYGIALAGVFQIIISEAGRRTREGQSQDQITDDLRPVIEAILDDLDRWLAPTTKRSPPNKRALSSDATTAFKTAALAGARRAAVPVPADRAVR